MGTAALAHFGGAALLHVALPAALAYVGLGAGFGNLGGVLVFAILAAVVMPFLFLGILHRGRRGTPGGGREGYNTRRTT